MEFEGLAPSARLLLAGLLFDALFGDPQVWFHPVRLLGSSLKFFEQLLRRFGADGYAGGCILFAGLAVVWVALPSLGLSGIYRLAPSAGMAVHVVIVFVCMALRDLIDHVRKVQKAAQANDLSRAHAAIAMFVGRDTERMDLAACRRAAIESLSESFVDGFVAAVFWYAVAGVPGLLAFKVVSTMDSMVGYKTERYVRFGWCGARLDDVMNYIPARLAWLFLGLPGGWVRGLSARKAWRIGLEQHAVVPGPNPGWSEATMAGLLQRRLIGPIWKNGKLVTDAWLGDSRDAPAGSDADVTRAVQATAWAAAITVLIAATLLW